MSDTQNRCPDCGAPLADEALLAGCPACLLEAGVDDDDLTGLPSTESLVALFPELEIQSLLGRGGMGAVFRARQTQLDRTVALKLLAPQTEREGAAFAERFGREAKALARLDHPGIVRVHDFGERGGLYFLLMEFVDGVSLREALQDGEMRPRQALAIIPQICDALQYAHDQGVVHRDIKPENVLMGKDGTVKVADFGLAKLVVGATEDATLTRAGQVMGTLHYMAPEQVESPGSVDHRADIYSLGVVFYEMLTGELPIGRFDVPSRRAVLDARLDEVVLRALERKRDRRYQQVSEVKTAVSAIEDPGSGALRRRPLPEAPREGKARGRRFNASVPAMLSLLVPLVAILLTPFVGGAPRELGGDVHGSFLAMANTIGALGFLGLCLGIAGILDTRAGRRSGRWMAVVGVLAALVWTPMLITGAYYGIDVEGNQQRDLERWRNGLDVPPSPVADTTAGGSSISPDLADRMGLFQDPTFEVVRSSGNLVPEGMGAAFKARLTYLLGAVAAAQDGNDPRPPVELLLSPLSEDELPKDDFAAARGRHGLVFVSMEVADLERFRLASVLLEDGIHANPVAAIATARSDTHELTFRIKRDPARDDWFLTADPIGLTRLGGGVEEPVVEVAEPVTRVYNDTGTGILGGENSILVRRIQALIEQFTKAAAAAPLTAEQISPWLDEDVPRVIDPLEGAISTALPHHFIGRRAPWLADLRVTEVRYTDPLQSGADLVCVAGERELTFPVVRSNQDWYFDMGRVLGDLPVAGETELSVYDHLGALQPDAVQSSDAIAIQQMFADFVDVAATGPLGIEGVHRWTGTTPPDDAPENIREEWGGSVREQIANAHATGWEIGLPPLFFDAAEPRLEGFEVTEIRFTNENRARALVTAAKGDGRLVFPLAEAFDNWLFDAGRITVEWPTESSEESR